MAASGDRLQRAGCGVDFDGCGLQARRADADADLAGFGAATLHDGHAEAVEGAALDRVVRFVAAWVAIADADDCAGAGDGECHFIVRGGHGPALRVDDLHVDDYDVLAVCGDFGAVGGRDDLCGWAAGLALFGERDSAILAGAGFDDAGRVLHLPDEVAVLLYRLRAEAGAVEEELDRVLIAVRPDLDLLAFFAGPVPVWEEVKG